MQEKNFSGRTTMPLTQVTLQYTGNLFRDIIGSITGNKYHFRHYGDLQKVDQEDVSAMLQLPDIKKRTQTFSRF